MADWTFSPEGMPIHEAMHRELKYPYSVCFACESRMLVMSIRPVQGDEGKGGYHYQLHCEACGAAAPEASELYESLRLWKLVHRLAYRPKRRS